MGAETRKKGDDYGVSLIRAYGDRRTEFVEVTPNDLLSWDGKAKSLEGLLHIHFWCAKRLRLIYLSRAGLENPLRLTTTMVEA